MVEENNNRLRNIALLLESAGVKIGYLYEKELYAGALVHEQGMEDIFRAHAHTVYNRLKEYGIRRMITVDPHTTNVLRSVYPEIIEDFDAPSNLISKSPVVSSDIVAFLLSGILYAAPVRRDGSLLSEYPVLQFRCVPVTSRTESPSVSFSDGRNRIPISAPKP